MDTKQLLLQAAFTKLSLGMPLTPQDMDLITEAFSRPINIVAGTTAEAEASLQRLKNIFNG